MKSRIVFGDEKLKGDFERLKTENVSLYKSITRIFQQLEKNAFSGIQIPKKLIPVSYKKNFSADNLWKCNLPSGWRLFYTIKRDEIIVLSIILDWMKHKNYERKFKY
ncbi:hypothetical protein C4573_07010 [Candidatus Woesearchaeota archaeon]|nr:MAG: hypothetical protein C4573_07010 [Candidatus Woesearchaeota archaeon]